MPPVTLTRRELYDLIWAKPMRDAAEGLGISDVGLRKVCERHRVPVPEQGYWNRVNAGQSPRKAVFVEVSDPHINRVAIHGRLTGLSDNVRSTLAEAREASRSIQMRPAPVVAKPPATEPLKQPYPTVAATVRALRSGRTNEKGSIKIEGGGLFSIDVGSKCVERTVSFLDSLVRSLESSSMPVEPSTEGIRIGSLPDTATISIVEVTRRQKHTPTEEELLKKKSLDQKWHRDYERYNRNPSLGGPTFERAYPEFDWERHDVLYLEIGGWDEGVRHKWSDGKHQTLEDLVESITTGIREVLAVRSVRREEREDYERRRAEALRRQELAKKRREREKHRTEFFERLERRSAEIVRIRAWLAAYVPAPEDRFHMARMVEWLRGRLRDFEGSIEPELLESDLIKRNLFPAVDDLHDPLGEPSDDVLPRW